jgi:hypothetical protein
MTYLSGVNSPSQRFLLGLKLQGLDPYQLNNDLSSEYWSSEVRIPDRIAISTTESGAPEFQR